MSYIPLLLTNKIDIDIIIKICGMLLFYAFTNTKFIDFIKNKIKFNYINNKYTHTVKYTYECVGPSFHGGYSTEYKIILDYVFKILKNDIKNKIYKTFSVCNVKHIESVEKIEIEKNIYISIYKKELPPCKEGFVIFKD